MKKILFTMRPKNTSSGGGVFFVRDLVHYFQEHNYIITYQFEKDIDLIFIIDPRRNCTNHISIDTILNYKKYLPNVKLLYAVNECDIKREVSINLEPLIIKCILNCDFIVFISNWLKDYYFKKYDEVKEKFGNNFKVINNACDPKIFYQKDNKKINKNKIKIVTHHWSNNYFKGFEIYNKLDKILPSLKNIEFTYIGNYNKKYIPKNINYIPPTCNMDLSNEIRKHDIYLTASLYEPGGIHQLEGMSCGLPVLYRRNGGGIKESVKNAGEEFNDIKDMLEKLNKIINNYETYTKNIDYEFLSSKRFGREYFEVIKILIANS